MEIHWPKDFKTMAIPCRLSPAFTLSLIFGEKEVSDDVLYESLLLFVSQSIRQEFNHHCVKRSFRGRQG